MLKLSKKVMKSADRIGMGEIWITQGHFMVKKECFGPEGRLILSNMDTYRAWLGKRQGVIGSEERPTDGMCEQLLSEDKDDAAKYIKTRWQFKGDFDILVLFQSDDNHLFLNQEYVNMLDIEEIWSKGNNDLCVVYEDDKPIKAVMPVSNTSDLPGEGKKAETV